MIFEFQGDKSIEILVYLKYTNWFFI